VYTHKHTGHAVSHMAEMEAKIYRKMQFEKQKLDPLDITELSCIITYYILYINYSETKFRTAENP
jgi:hypothetical protein